MVNMLVRRNIENATFGEVDWKDGQT